MAIIKIDSRVSSYSGQSARFYSQFLNNFIRQTIKRHL